jgi:hypothetical protein
MCLMGAGYINSRKSTSRYLITYLGGAVSWQSRLQKCVALSTTKVEYIAITEAAKELLWMKNSYNNWVYNNRCMCFTVTIRVPIELGPMVFTFALEGFPRKNLGVLLVGCLIIIVLL